MSELSSPLTLRRGRTWRNRLFLAPMTNLQSNDDGTLTDVEIDWLSARGRGGFGQVMTAAAFVTPEGRAWPGQLGVHDDAMLPGMEKLASTLRATGARSSVQLHHGGMRANHELNGLPNRGPWSDESRATVELTTGEVEGILEATVAAAVRCEKAGFDGVQLHAAHGYLWGQFMDPRSNHRTDRFGGSVSARAAFTLETLAAIEQATGDDFEVGVRLTPEGYGIPLSEAVAIVASVLASQLVDTVDLSMWDCFMVPRKVDTGRLLVQEFLDLPRHGTRLGITGKVETTEQARWALGHPLAPHPTLSAADFVGLGLVGIIEHDAAARMLLEESGGEPFLATPRPVSADHLRAQAVGEPLLDYLSTEWDDIVN